jgi:hypothetical protein
MMNSIIPMKKRKANDGRPMMDEDGAHDVNTNYNINDGGGFLSSWLGYYFSGRRDAAPSAPSCDENLSQMERMEKIMMRVEEKLSHVSSLESRCEQLEAKCSSLEDILETNLQSMKEHFDRKIDPLYLHVETKSDLLDKRLEANLCCTKEQIDSLHVKVDTSLKRQDHREMLIKNQSWEYSAPVDTVDDWLFDTNYSEAEAEYIADTAEELKKMTLNMRRGEFPDENFYDMDKGIYLAMNDADPQFGYAVNDELLPHWEEFAAALEQFNPAINLLPDDCESFFTFYFVQLNHDAMLLIKEALMYKPFTKLSFTNNNNGDGGRGGGMSVDAIMDIVESNTHLRKLDIKRNSIGNQHIERLCSAVHNHPLVELCLFDNFEPGIGDEMLTSLLTNDDLKHGQNLKLEKLDMSSNNITSGVSPLMADFLVTNPRLKELDLGSNHLNDSDAVLIANTLRSNTTLTSLDLTDNNNISDVGIDAFRLVLFDESSLNAVADSNHICTVCGLGYFYWNRNDFSEVMKDNRGRKIYSILSSRNKTMSNVEHFGNFDVKLLPNMLETVQRYSKYVVRWHKHEVEALSIVYEVMRKWDKVFPLYKSSGAGNIDT